MGVTVLRSSLDASVNIVLPATTGDEVFEARLVHRDNRAVIYLSSAVGCNQGCKMCHLTATRQTQTNPATIGDFIRQAELAYQHLPKDWEAPAVHYNWMARGEALLNQVIRLEWSTLTPVLERLAAQWGAHARYHISTIMPRGSMGLVDSFSSGPAPTLYYSIYSARPDIRKHWLPRAMPLKESLGELKRYQDHTGKLVVLHSPWITGVNDTEEDCQLIADAVLASGLQVKWNTVRYNPPPGSPQESPGYRVLTSIMGQLLHCPATVIDRVGEDVYASCGTFIGGVDG